MKNKKNNMETNHLALNLASQVIRNRRSIFPQCYNGKPIQRAIVEEMLENANWAPTHRMTEPWRFKVMSGPVLERLGDFLANFYKLNTPAEKFSQRKLEKTAKKPRQCAYVIAICMQRDPMESVPEFEEIAAVACAVQNMWLTASAHGIGAYWSTPSVIHSDDIRPFLNLETGERCLGFFYMGQHDLPQIVGKRKPIEEKTVWIWE